MDGDCVSINIDDHEIRERRRARLKALESVKEPHRQVELKFRGNPRLHTAAKEGDMDKFIEVLEKYSAKEGVSLSDNIDMKVSSGNSLLHIAVGIEKGDILQALLEVIGDKRLAAKVNFQGDTALHVEARAGRIHTAELFLGCDSIMDMGNTTLHEVVRNRHFEVIHLLLNRGSRSVNQENQESKCPLYLAVEMGDLKILMRLMQAVDGNEVRRPRMQGMSPVHEAVMHHKLDTCPRAFCETEKLVSWLPLITPM